MGKNTHKYMQRHVNIYGQGESCVVVRLIDEWVWPSSTVGEM